MFRDSENPVFLLTNAFNLSGSIVGEIVMNLPSKSNFRILSLDGGGLRGVVAATILKQVEAQIRAKENQSLTEYFDLVAGTSTGAILAAGIAVGRTADYMINMYREKSEKIFDRMTRRFRNYIPGGGGYLIPLTRYKNQGLITVLKEALLFPDQSEIPRLIDIENRPNSPTLLILAYNTSQGYTQYFDSNGVELDPRQPRWYTQFPLWEICLCSAAAPTFFPPHQLPNKQGEFDNYIDGGVAANNPALAAATHAVYTKVRKGSQVPLDPSDIAILSIGTGHINHSFDFQTINRWGLIEWARKIPDIFLAAPDDFSEKVIRQLLSYSSFNKQYLRINLALDRSLAAIDNPSLVSHLIQEVEQYLSPDENGRLISRYDYQTGTVKHQKLKDLIARFVQNNSRDPDDGFINRF